MISKDVLISFFCLTGWMDRVSGDGQKTKHFLCICVIWSVVYGSVSLDGMNFYLCDFSSLWFILYS